MSPGRTGRGHRNSSTPKPTEPPASRRPPVTNNFIDIAAVCQPLAARPSKTLRFAASKSRWNGCGSKSCAKSTILSSVTSKVPESNRSPTCRSSKYRSVMTRSGNSFGVRPFRRPQGGGYSVHFLCCANLNSRIGTCHPPGVDMRRSGIQLVPHRQGSSAVEQGTHKPLVGSSILPSGTFTFRAHQKMSAFYLEDLHVGDRFES